MKYDLAALIRARGKIKAPSALFPLIQHSPAMERALLAALRRIEQAAVTAITNLILPSYRKVITTDADTTTFDLFRQLVRAQATAAEGQVAQLLNLEAKKHTKQFMAAARRAFGVDLSAIIGGEDLGKYMEQVTLRNAGLIQGLSDDIIKRVQQETSASVIAGRSSRELQVLLKEQLGFADSRARLIARDQTAKFSSDLNRIRHEQAGLLSYIWRTSQDERVRSRHRELEGKVYEYGKPTGAEQGLPPGQPVQCRCIAQAVVEFAKATATPAPAPTPTPSPKPPAAPKPAPAPVKSWAEGGPMPAPGTPTPFKPKAKAAPKPAGKYKTPEQIVGNTPSKPPGSGFFVNPNYKPTPQPAYKPIPASGPGSIGYVAPTNTASKLTTPRLNGRKPPAGTVGLDINTGGGYQTVNAATEAAEKSGAKYASGRKHTAVNEYIQGSDWREFNKNLRMGRPLSQKHSKQAADLDAIVSASPLKKPLVVYRGVSARATNLTNLEVGDAFIDPSFMSTSVRPDVSEGFAGNGAVMRMLLPKGHKASIIGLGDDIASSMGYEAEVLLGRGMHFRVVSVTMETGVGGRSSPIKVIDLEVVPNG